MDSFTVSTAIHRKLLSTRKTVLSEQNKWVCLSSYRNKCSHTALLLKIERETVQASMILGHRRPALGQVCQSSLKTSPAGDISEHSLLYSLNCLKFNGNFNVCVYIYVIYMCINIPQHRVFHIYAVIYITIYAYMSILGMRWHDIYDWFLFSHAEFVPGILDKCSTTELHPLNLTCKYFIE